MTTIFGGIPFLRDKQIVFPEGEFDLDNGTLASLENMFRSSYPNPKTNHRTFNHSDGELIAFFHPAEPVTKTSKVLAIDYLPKKRMFLSRFTSFYKNLESPSCVPSLPDEHNVVSNFMVVFSLNLHLICVKDGDLFIAKTICFLNTDHVKTCTCNNCAIVRNLILETPVSQRPKVPVVWH